MQRKGMLGLCGVGVLAAVGGCSKSSEDAGWFSSKPTATVRAGEFAGEVTESPNPALRAARAPVTPVGEAKVVGTQVMAIGGPAPVANSDPAPVGAGTNAGTSAGTGATSVAATGGGLGTGAAVGAAGLSTSVGAPKLEAAVDPTGRPMIIDAVVGQVNGRPVFATEVLEPLDGSLRAAGQESKNVGEWRDKATDLIGRELNRRIYDELILSEAKRGLTPEQKQGLLHFLGQIESQLVSENAGSQVKADQQLREQTGRSLKQEAEDKRDQALIVNELATKVDPRVAVPWRDVQNEYEKQYDKWHPPAEYTFRLIYTPTANAEAVAKLQGLISGGAFEKAAEDQANEYNRREQGKLVRKTGVGQSAGKFLPWPDVNGAAQRLAVGETAGPIVFAPEAAKPTETSTAWVHLDKIDQPPATSLYDAQLEVAADLRETRSIDERKRYFERLLKRGNVSRLEVMGGQLLRIATERYAPRFMPPVK